MSGLILTTQALKVTNRGGGIYRGLPRKGSDYVVFICPHRGCGHRNKISVDQSESYVPSDSSALAFKCKMCRNTTEVTPPMQKLASSIPQQQQQSSLIVTPEQFTAEMAARRRELSGYSGKLGRA